MRANKFNSFYFTGTLDYDYHVITKDEIIEKCVIIENYDNEIFLSVLVDHLDN